MKQFAVLTILFLLFFYSAPPASGAVDVQILEKEILATIEVAGVYQCSLKITFEEVMGLNENAINITAAQINPLDPTIVSRLQVSSLMSIPNQFPLMISISPSSSSSLSFTGAVEIELFTSNLAFTANTPLRLFKAPSAGTFEDISNFVGMGSYRVRGTSGDFSDFLIVLDVRNTGEVIQDKFLKLQQSITTNASRIQPEMLQALQEKLGAAHDSYQAGLKLQAAGHLQDMIHLIKEDDGTAIPNTYRANDPNTRNVAGELRRRATTLIFSLNL